MSLLGDYFWCSLCSCFHDEYSQDYCLEIHHLDGVILFRNGEGCYDIWGDEPRFDIKSLCQGVTTIENEDQADQVIQAIKSRMKELNWTFKTPFVWDNRKFLEGADGTYIRPFLCQKSDEDSGDIEESPEGSFDSYPAQEEEEELLPLESFSIEDCKDLCEKISWIKKKFEMDELICAFVCWLQIKCLKNTSSFREIFQIDIHR